MYYKDDFKEEIKEGYTEHLTPPQEKSTGFPMCLLILLIVAIIAIGLWFLYILRRKKKGQDFGFHFY